jgi:hypothetical protein
MKSFRVIITFTFLATVWADVDADSVFTQVLDDLKEAKESCNTSDGCIANLDGIGNAVNHLKNNYASNDYAWDRYFGSVKPYFTQTYFQSSYCQNSVQNLGGYMQRAQLSGGLCGYNVRFNFVPLI